MKIIEAPAVEYAFQDFAADCPPVAQRPGKGAQFLIYFRSRINVILNLLQRAPAELSALVYRAEGAPVPGTVSGESKKQAPCFTWRTYGTLFEGHLFHRLIPVLDIGFFQKPARAA
jgi:hypothetical protein